MRFKESLCRSRLHRNVNNGLRGLTVVLAVVMIVSAMSSANVMDGDSESCSGTVAASIVAAATEHDALSPEDQLLFLKVRGDSVADASLLTIVVFSPAARHHPLTKIYRCCYRTWPTGIKNQLPAEYTGKQNPAPTCRVHFREELERRLRRSIGRIVAALNSFRKTNKLHELNVSIVSFCIFIMWSIFCKAFIISKTILYSMQNIVLSTNKCWMSNFWVININSFYDRSEI